MKKFLVMAMAAAGVLTACTSNDDLGGGVDSTDLQQIKLGVSNATVSTRGTGTVGDLEDGDNTWAGEYIWVSMLDKGTLKATEFKGVVDGVETTDQIFYNHLFKAPVGETSHEATSNTGKIGYYPANGQSDFWGFRVDNAVNGDATAQVSPVLCDNNNAQVGNADEATRLVLDVDIDGSQDIMAGKAELSEENKEALAGSRSDDFYSAYSARKGVQPNISFNHLLTRMTFKVKAGNKAAAGDGVADNAVTVKGVSIKSLHKGKLVVAYTEQGKPENVLTFSDVEGEEGGKDLALKQRVGGKNTELQSLTEVPLTWNVDEQVGDELPIGEALLVAPGQQKYHLTLNLQQKVANNVDGTTEVRTIPFEYDVQLGKNSVETFKAGNSYEILITVYGNERIEVTATLVPWKNGGKIDIDDDKDDSPIYTPAGE